MDKLLVIDDEQSILDLLKVVFEKQGYSVKSALSAEKALKLLDEDEFDLVLTDVKLPQKSGMDILKYAKKTKPDIPVIMITAYGTIKQAVEAFKAGAVDYVLKPFDVEELKIIVKKGLKERKLKEENVLLKKELKERYSFKNMIGKSRPMQEIFGLIDKIADNDSTVLITGESGTGKEMAARAVHFHGKRKDQPFITVNCGALPENLLESELFGHVKGAFTGAVAHKKGMFQVADKGTLFLDEIGEMSPKTQVKVLRAIQEKIIRRVGGTEEIPVDVRIISATNQDLKEKLKQGDFREDLFYRLNVITFHMPPLRDRREDIPPLVNHFLKKHCDKTGIPMKRVAPEVINVFESYHWPGNIRELENVIERIVAIEERQTLTKKCLPDELLTPPEHGTQDQKIGPGFELDRVLDNQTVRYIREALSRSSGNMKKASSLLGINYRSLRYLIDKHSIKEER
ncbi:MAG: response regulator [Candidatus Aminicenantes bacterium]|nr:response regulator [Candidatus Aminicenantes bacterium]